MSDVAQKADASLSWNECCTMQMGLGDRGALHNIVVGQGALHRGWRSRSSILSASAPHTGMARGLMQEARQQCRECE